MLFILTMAVLHRLLRKAVQNGVLKPPPDSAIHHQCSIYADDVVLFTAPEVQDITTIREILNFFGSTSGLHTNLQKSLIAPIACNAEQVQNIQGILPAQIAVFPIQYLGLPLSVTRLKKSHFQSLIDKVAASIPTWKAPLMNKAGRLTTVKAVMSAICVHSFISLKVPDWVLHEIDKWRRGFLWAGRSKAHGGKCLVPWPSACRLPDYGGLGIPDLRIAAFSLRLRWLWLQKTNSDRPWRRIQLDFAQDQMLQNLFQTCIEVELGDGNLALFWTDNWLHQSSPCIIAPKLCKLIQPRLKKSRTVAQALYQKRWIQDIVRQLTVPALTEYVILWHVLQAVQLLPGVEDVVKWKWNIKGEYSAVSSSELPSDSLQLS